MKPTSLTRRQFGKTVFSSALGLSAALSFPGILSASTGKSRVIIARSDKLIRVNHQLAKENAAPFLDRAVAKLTGHSTPALAWKSLFSPGEKIGIKLSCLPGKPLSSSYGLVMAIVDSLRSSGIAARDIYIWERTGRELERAGFRVGQPGVRIVGTDSFSHGDGYSDAIEFAGSVGTRFSRIMEHVDALINVPVLKDHDLSGVSISMKNFYGAIYNPNKFHRNNCDPYIAELCTHPLIKRKQRLIVCDASRVQVNNGPAFYPRYAWEYGGILVSRDPVALDYLGWRIIEARRKELNLPSLKAVKREPAYIQTAARLKLGVIDEQYIDKIII
jgi:uncharacterized protein (DUF362 family)